MTHSASDFTIAVARRHQDDIRRAVARSRSARRRGRNP
jgi:hypothetical protein